MKNLFTLFFLLFALVLRVEAADIFVDKDNSCPGAGTTGDPYCTIQGAMTVAVAGDVIKIRDSATPYDESGDAVNSGTVGSRITIQPDAGHNPTLRNSNTNANEGAITIVDKDYWTIQNLTFDASGVATTSKFAIKIQGSTRSITGNTASGNTITGWGGTDQGGTGNGANVTAAASIGSFGGAAGSGIYATTTITGNTIIGSKQVGIRLQHDQNSIVSNNVITGTRCGVHSSTFYKEGDGIKISTDSVGAHIFGNLVGAHQTNADCTAAIPTPGAAGFVMAGIYCDTGGNAGIIEKNEVYDIGQAGVGIGIWLESRCNNWIVRRNTVRNIADALVRIGSGSCVNNTGNQIINNTLLDSGNHGIRMRAYVQNAVIKNNIITIKSTASVGIQVDPEATVCGGHTINYNLWHDNVSEAKIGKWGAGSVVNFANWKTACGCDANSPTPASPATVSSSNLTLTSSSPAINVGANLETCNGTCDIGRFETIHSPAPTCTVEDGDANTVRVTFTNNLSPPIQTGAVTGITIQVAAGDRTESAPTVVGTNIIHYTIDGAAVTNGQAVTWAASASNTITNSSGADATTMDQGLFATATIDCTNNVTGAPSGMVVTQTYFRFEGLRGTEAAPQILPYQTAAVNTQTKGVIGAKFRLRIKLACTVADCPAMGVLLRKNLNGGAYTALTDSFDSDNFRFYGVSDASSDILSQGTATTELLTSDHVTNVAGAIQRTAAAVPNIDLSQNSEVELVYFLEQDTDASAGDVTCFRLYNQDTTALTYTDAATPCVTTIAMQAGGGF